MQEETSAHTWSSLFPYWSDPSLDTQAIFVLYKDSKELTPAATALKPRLCFRSRLVCASETIQRGLVQTLFSLLHAMAEAL